MLRIEAVNDDMATIHGSLQMPVGAKSIYVSMLTSFYYSVRDV